MKKAVLLILICLFPRQLCPKWIPLRRIESGKNINEQMKSPIYYILALALCSCAVQRATTSEEFVRDVQKDIPFKVSDLKAVSGHHFDKMNINIA